MKHVDDKTLRCNGCLQNIHIPFNQVGGFWHLTGWENKHGIKFHGGYCSDCFDMLHDVKEMIKE